MARRPSLSSSIFRTVVTSQPWIRLTGCYARFNMGILNSDACDFCAFARSLRRHLPACLRVGLPGKLCFSVCLPVFLYSIPTSIFTYISNFPNF